MIPAAPKTYVVTRAPGASEGFTREPVIGYAYTAADNKPTVVLTLEGQRRLIDSAVLFPCGLVVDPVHGFTFADTDEWLAFTAGKRPSDKADSKHTKPTDKANVEAEVGGSAYDIEWTTKSFKTNSFWHYDDGEYEFIFIVEGGTNAPKATAKAKKITRNDYDKLKKTVDPLTLEDILNAEPVELGEEPDSEDPDDEDGDDDSGLL